MPATESRLGFLGHLDNIGLKIENVGHDFVTSSHRISVFGFG